MRGISTIFDFSESLNIFRMHIYLINKREFEASIYETIGELLESELQSRRYTLRGLSGI